MHGVLIFVFVMESIALVVGMLTTIGRLQNLGAENWRRCETWWSQPPGATLRVQACLKPRPSFVGILKVPHVQYGLPGEPSVLLPWALADEHPPITLRPRGAHQRQGSAQPL